MRKTLLFSTMLLAATSVWAFGGIFGGGHKSHNYNGVNSIGVHIDANGDNTTPDITLANCDAYAGTGLVDNETYNGGYAGLASDNQTQCRCETGSKWSDGACVPSDGASCSSWTTNECGSGYYCQFSPESCEEDPTEGVCQVVSSCGATGTYGDFWMSGQTNSVCSLDWWTAQSLCISQGMQLVSLQDLGCAGHEDDKIGRAHV